LKRCVGFDLMLVTCLAFASAFCQEKPRPPRRARVSVLIDESRALPPEFKADALLRLSMSHLVPGIEWKRRLIEEAFWSGSHAYLPYLQIADQRSDSVDMNAVRANGLEALTLQGRAVQAMAGVNPARALRLFEQIPQATPPELSCKIVFAPDLTIYYKTATLIFQKSFSSKEQSNGTDVLFLRQLVGLVAVPEQVPPALEMIFTLKLPSDERHGLLTVLSGRIQEIARSDREYGGAEHALTSAMNRMHSSDASVLLPALRPYIVRHASQHRCTENMPPKGQLSQSAEQFNRLVTKFDSTETRYKRISAEEAKPSGDDGTYDKHLIGQSPQSEAVMEALRWLTHGNRERNGKVLNWTLAERSDQEWLTHFHDADRLISELKEEDEASPESFFCMKSDALNTLAALAPPGPGRDAAMSEYIELLEDYYSSIENPNLWFTMFRHMLYTARFSEDPANKVWILQRLGRSTNPIVSLYAKVELTIGPPAAANSL
jgi:hypothetical protein